MNIRSKQSILSILAGTIVGLLVSIFLQPTCWGPIVGVFLAAYLAKVSSPKEGALIGAIVLAPIGIFAFLLTLPQTLAIDNLGILVTVFAFFVIIVSASGIGALYGLIIGKLFQLTKDKKVIF